MTTMKANCIVDSDCLMTTNHAASSYGRPVVVAADGSVAYSPAEAGAVNVAPVGPEDADEIALIEAARAAGYQVYA